MQIPVLLIIYRRPDLTAQVFESIRKAAPPRLYVAADGPKSRSKSEAALICRARSVATSVDWPCQVFTLFQPHNLGCRFAPQAAFSWFFEHETKGIILEDDCLPSPSFYPFCEQLLSYYEHNPRVFSITGYNATQSWNSAEQDYFFSAFGGIWGWASWRRAWKHFDPQMSHFESFASSGSFQHHLGRKLGTCRLRQLKLARKELLDGSLTAWSYQWAFTRHLHNALTIVPSVNLISNIGFGPDSTHTTNSVGSILHESMDVNSPVLINTHESPDLNYDFKFLSPPTFFSKISRLLNRFRFSA